MVTDIDLSTKKASATLLPQRAKSHPLRVSGKSQPAAKSSEPFNPEELDRRLEKWIQREGAAREARRKRDAKKKPPSNYHHVPQVAAADFVNTATPEALKNQEIHPLSRSMLKWPHLAEGIRTASSKMGIRPKRRESMGDMTALSERNQFQWTQTMREAANSDKSRGLYKPLQRDFDAFAAHGLASASSAKVILEDVAELPTAGESTKAKSNRFAYQPGDRHDWTQREESEEGKSAFKDHFIPALRNAHLLKREKEEDTSKIKK